MSRSANKLQEDRILRLQCLAAAGLESAAGIATSAEVNDLDRKIKRAQQIYEFVTNSWTTTDGA